MKRGLKANLLEEVLNFLVQEKNFLSDIVTINWLTPIISKGVGSDIHISLIGFLV